MLESAYLIIAVVLLLTLVGGIVRIVRGPSPADRMLAAQLFGTTGVAVLLVLSPLAAPSLRDVALVFSLLAAVNAAVFVRRGGSGARKPGTSVTVLEVISVLLLLAGAAFFAAGTIGLLRFPDVLAAPRGDGAGTSAGRQHNEPPARQLERRGRRGPDTGPRARHVDGSA